MKIPTDWTFEDKEVANSFDDHVREQLPWYDLTTEMVAHFGRHYIPENGQVYDVGASTGNIGRILGNTLHKRNANFVAVEKSKEMAEKYDGPKLANGKHTLEVCDVQDYPFEKYDFAVCFLVFMFIHPAKRKHLLLEILSKCNPGGALILFDKFESHMGYVGTVLSRMAMAAKLANGADAEHILQKELSLAGIQRPMNLRHDLPAEGIQIFAFGDFQGYVYEGR